MTVESKNQLFRLAAVLYADNNYEVSSKTIHRKIIESSLFDNENKQMTIHQIIDFIEANYHFTFDEEEIKSIVTSPKEDGFHLGKDKGNNYLVCLTEQRRQTLLSKINTQNIDYFITEFIKQDEKVNNVVDAKGLLYKFLYDLINSNISGFSKLLNSKKQLTELINVEQSQFNELEREIINNFLSWDNDGKNKAIFDIASYGIEYCLITNNSANSIHLNSLKNKTFYLDTNVIFRALGINGENRQKRTISFLTKFNEAGETLIISRFSETEFKATVKYYISLIAKHNSPRINPRVFTAFKAQSDFFDFYHKWRINRTNTSLDYFESHINVLFEDLIKKFKASIDYKMPFDEKEEKTAKLLNEIAGNIHSYKSSEGSINGFETSNWDAKNIHLIEKRRDGKDANLVETKFFFLSTDQGLRRWDFQRSNVTPIVLLPSQWMSILLRYVKRTNDDFKSFVSFLNMPQGEKEISYEKLQLILTGISEITEDAEKQSSIIKILVEKKFKDVLQKGFSDDEIIEQSKSFAKTTLEQNLDELSAKHSVLEYSFESHKVATSVKIEDLESKTDEQGIKLNSKEQEVKRLKAALKIKTVKEDIRKWAKPAYWLIPVGILIVVFTVLQFCCKDWTYNYSYKIITAIDRLESETQKNTLRALMYAPLIGLWMICSFCFNRLTDSEDKQNKKREFENKFDETHK
ncbi:MAG: hypothetical protein EAZ53_10225 [Bacteroidetes bacterium]|nr:MAG: hypothetical protein EAZ53_10225 [Bacteroidota bacterium]